VAGLNLVNDDRYARFPEGFFDRSDSGADSQFYEYPRIVTHIDDGAIAMVSALYDELGLSGSTSGHQLDLMSSWVSHFTTAPTKLTVLGMNANELERNTQATDRVVLDLNESPLLPFPDNTFDGAMCCVSVDYLVRPIEVFDEVARVLKPERPFVCTFSNRCFPTKAIRGWMQTNDADHCAIVAEYFRLANGFSEPTAQQRRPVSNGMPTHDPLFAVWAFTEGTNT
jgi:SAM-dependent methyltransferase